MNTYKGRPVGQDEFLRDAERALNRPLQARKGGRPCKVIRESGQGVLLVDGACG